MFIDLVALPQEYKIPKTGKAWVSSSPYKSKLNHNSPHSSLAVQDITI